MLCNYNTSKWMYTSKNLMVYNIYSSFNGISSNLYIVHLWKVVDGTLKKGSILRTILENKTSGNGVTCKQT